MTADAGEREAAVRHLRRAVVRTAGAVPRGSRRRRDGLLEHGFLRFEEGESRTHAVAVVEAREPAGDHARDLRDREIALRGQQPVAARCGPLAAFVELADDARAGVLAPVVELFLQLVLDHLALLLDDEDFLEPARELADAVGFERPGHRDLEHADADLGGRRFVDAEFLERFQHVHVRLARRDDAEPRVRRIDRRAVQLVGAGVRDGGVDAVVLHQRFLLARLDAERVGRQPAVQPAFRHREVLGVHDARLVEIRRDRRGRFDGVGERLERDGATGVARHREAVEAQLDVFLDVARIQHRDHRCREQVIALVRQRGRVRTVVVAGDEQHAAVLRRAGEIHVLEDVAAAVDARALAVPEGEHAVVVGVADEVHLLRAPDGGRGEFLVHARHELHVVRFEVRLRLPERLVEAAERAAAIPGHEARGVQAGRGVAAALGDQQADERLDAGEVDAAGRGLVLVVECDLLQLHVGLLWDATAASAAWMGQGAPGCAVRPVGLGRLLKGNTECGVAASSGLGGVGVLHPIAAERGRVV